MKPPRPRCCGAAARTGGRTCARKVFPDASAFPPAPATVALGMPHGGGARRARATAGRRARAGSRVGLDEAPGREGGSDRATGPGLGRIGRLAQRPTLVAEGGARGACRGVEVPPVRPPGWLGCLAIVGPARPLCLPPALWLPGVHAGSPPLPQIPVIVAGPLRPLLTTLSDVSAPCHGQFTLCLRPVVFPGALVPFHDRIYVAEPRPTRPRSELAFKGGNENHARDSHTRPLPRSAAGARRGPSVYTLRTPAPGLLAAGQGHRGPGGRSGARAGTLSFCRFANPSRPPAPCQIDFQPPLTDGIRENNF